ncbi:Protein yellow [Camponotus floridanus]|uniref:Protein yellow n=1 Tax=Camponotus floridanus TaxID=104421 RepID=E1ZZY1_CAMFO|nr:protein yellow [Camponotus floridanus]XP_011268592.1 protein yellow [Camponotus floridanus]EFN73253.1 Protein yellow [Camponotus floridanus]
MLYLLFLACLATATGHTFNTVYSWKQVEFKLPNDTIRNEYIASGDYIPDNNMPLGLATWHNKMFVTIPRWRNGVLATLNSFPMTNTHSPILTPYPNFEANDIHSSDGLVSIFRVRIDACDRMWGLDTGVDDVLGNYTVVRPMTLTVIDLKTDKIIRKYVLKDTDVKPNSFIADLVVDVVPGQCDKAYVYMSDLGENGIVVYDWEKNDSWRISHHFFHFDPLNGDYNVNGYNFQWADGVFGMSLSPICGDGYRTLYFHAMSGITEFFVSTNILQDNTLKKWEDYANFHIVGNKGPLTQGPSSIIDSETSVDYFTQVNRNGIACWDTKVKLNPKTFKLVAQDNTTLVFPQDIAIDNNYRQLYVLSNNLQKFLHGSFDPLTTNFFITSADLGKLTTLCKNNTVE